MRKNVTRGFFIPALCAQVEESGKDSGWQLEWGIGEDFVDDLNFSGPAPDAVFQLVNNNTRLKIVFHGDTLHEGIL